MGNTVDVNENEYAVASFEQKLAARSQVGNSRYPMTAQGAECMRLFELRLREGFRIWPEGAGTPSSRLREVIGSLKQ